MSKKCICIFLLFAFAFESKSQDSFKIRYNEIRSAIQEPFETLRPHTNFHNNQIRDTFFVDHIVSKYSIDMDLLKHISNRYLLTKFVDVTLKQLRARLAYYDQDTIVIDLIGESKSTRSLGHIRFDSTVRPTNKKSEFDFNFISTIDGVRPYGFTFVAENVSRLTSISISVDGKEFLISEEFWNDLYFPNLCETDYAIKPVEAFMSSDRNFIYMYLFGGQPNNTYFSKFIIDIQAKKCVGRMIADMKELSDYQCLYPKKFIGF